MHSLHPLHERTHPEFTHPSTCTSSFGLGMSDTARSTHPGNLLILAMLWSDRAAVCRITSGTRVPDDRSENTRTCSPGKKSSLVMSVQ